MGRLRWKVPESHCHGSLNYFYGAFLPGFLRSVVLICLVLSPYFREGNGTHSSTLAWKIPWTEEPGRLQSMGLLRVRHD